jgi:hypothetical protein
VELLFHDDDFRQLFAYVDFVYADFKGVQILETPKYEPYKF